MDLPGRVDYSILFTINNIEIIKVNCPNSLSATYKKPSKYSWSNVTIIFYLMNAKLPQQNVML